MQSQTQGSLAFHSRISDKSRKSPPASVATRAPRDAALLNALTIIAHDLRGPLANLAILIELIDTNCELEQHGRVAASTRKAQQIVTALDAMLNGFLDRVRQTGDPLSFRPMMVDAGDLMRRAVSLNLPIADSRGIVLDTSGIGPTVFEGDGRLLLEAIDNLIANAVKHTPSGTRVRCETRRHGRDVILAVSDEGEGLSESALRAAFRPFAALASTYKTKGASWGLGLWIVRLIAERHGGTVDVTICPQLGGARFELRLPG